MTKCPGTIFKKNVVFCGKIVHSFGTTSDAGALILNVNSLLFCFSFFRIDPYGLVGQWLTDALNPSVYTYEVSPVFTLMEEVVLQEMREIVGFPNGEGDGIFCPGGSIANGYGISCARYQIFPEIKVRSV